MTRLPKINDGQSASARFTMTGVVATLLCVGLILSLAPAITLADEAAGTEKQEQKAPEAAQGTKKPKKKDDPDCE